MAQDVAGIERIEQRPIALEPARIEAEFDRIWQESEGDGYDRSSVRLRVLNFVGLGFGGAADDAFERVMASLPERHPCRGILAVIDEDQSEVEAAISAHCWRGAGHETRVCSEDVLLRGGADHERALASVVLALLIPEIPVDVWLAGVADLTRELVQEVLEAADRVHIDSARTAEPLQAYRDVLALRDDLALAVCDLAWRRLSAWRSLVAQLFDNDDAIRELDRLQSVEIVGGRDRPSSEALLLAGWFVSRLGLTPADISERSGGFSAALYDGSRGIRLSVMADPQGLPLREVTVKSEGATFLVEAHAASGHIHVRETWPTGQPHRVVATQPDDDATVIIAALDDPGDDAIQADAMRAILGLSG